MQIKQILIILFVITIIIGILYYLMSPYQNCLRIVEKKFQENRNKLATETNVYKRKKIELDTEELVTQREFGCFDRTSW